MKFLDDILDDLMPNLGAKRPGPSVRDRTGVDVDEDLFVPAAGRAAPAHSISLKASLATDPTGASIDLDERPWPTLAMPLAKPVPNLLESRIVEQDRELAMRCTQVADLYNLQERQTAELQAAYAEIERLNAAFSELQVNGARLTTKAAERKQALGAMYQENAVLRGKLEGALDQSAAMANKMLTVESMFNDREMVITTALEQAALLKAEAEWAAAENIRLTAALGEAERQQEDERARNAAVIDELNRKLESLFADHGVQLKTREKLARRCDELNRITSALERAGEDARNKLVAQAEHTTFLETILRVERETAEARIAEMANRLEEERLERVQSDRTSNAIRQEMAVLLRAISRQRAEASRIAVSQRDAA